MPSSITGVIAWVSICVWPAIFSTAVWAQSSTTSFSKLTMQGPAEQIGTSIIRDALGRPCLDAEAAARAHVVNPDLKDHVVSLKNNCPRLIKVKVCYYNSDHCQEMVLQGYRRSDIILGSMRGVDRFRYSLTQK